jgi:hypothetical protein
MAATLVIIGALVDRLKAAFPDLAVEYFPDKPDEYRLNHPKGALLISYLGAKYQAPVDTTVVVQDATVKFSVTAQLRQLNGGDGAVAILTRLRLALLGFKPPDCRRKVWAVAEHFLGEKAGIWQYALDVATEAVAVEDFDTVDGPPMVHITTVGGMGRNEIRKAPDGSTNREEFPE